MGTEADELGIQRASTLDVLMANILAVIDNMKILRVRSSEDMESFGDGFEDYKGDLKDIKDNQDDNGNLLSLLQIDTRSWRINTALLKANWNLLLSRLLLGYYNSTGALTGNGQILPRAGWLGGMVVNTDGFSDARLVLYDSLKGDDKELYRVYVPGGDNQGGKFFGTKPIRFLNGCTRKLWGTHATCIIYYR